MAKVIAPKAWKHVEKRCGVDFKDGVGRTSDEAALAFFVRQGYTIERSQRRSSTSGDNDPGKGQGDS